MDAAAFLVDADSLSAKSLLLRTQTVGEAAISACGTRDATTELTRQAALLAAYTCYIQEAATLAPEILPESGDYATYEITVPALSTGQSLTGSNTLQMRVGRFDTTMRFDLCLEEALVAHYQVTGSVSALTFSGNATFKGQTQTFDDLATLEFELAFANLNTVPTTGTLGYADVASATLSLSSASERSVGTATLGYDQDSATNTLEAALNIIDDDTDVSLALAAMVDAEVGSANYRMSGYYPVFTADELIELGVPQTALEAGLTYCFDPDIKAFADEAQETCAADPNNPLCYGLLEEDGSTCAFDEDAVTAFDTQSGELLDDAESPYASEVAAATLPTAVAVSVSFGDDAWACSLGSDVVTLDLSDGDFSQCTDYLQTAFPDEAAAPCLRALDGEATVN